MPQPHGLGFFLHGWIGRQPSRTEGDSIAYQLANPQNYIRAGKIYCIQGDLWGCFPEISTLYLLALKLKGDVLARLIPWFLSLILAGMIVAFGRRFLGSRRLGLVAAAIFCAQPVFSSFIGTAMQDSLR